MAFGLPNSGGGDIMPFIKYNSKAGRFYRVDRLQNASGWESQDVDITDNFSAVFDLESLLVGWAYFGANGPQRVMSLYGKEPTPPQPADVDDKGKKLFKGGFKITLALAKECGGGVRELSANAACVMTAMEALYDAFKDAPERKQGKVPAVRLAGTQVEKGNFGTNYRPVFQIVAWVDRPASLAAPAARPQNGNGASAHAPATAPPISTSTLPPSTGSTQVGAPPPAAQQAPQQPVSAGDFG